MRLSEEALFERQLLNIEREVLKAILRLFLTLLMAPSMSRTITIERHDKTVHIFKGNTYFIAHACPERLRCFCAQICIRTLYNDIFSETENFPINAFQTQTKTFTERGTLGQAKQLLWATRDDTLGCGTNICNHLLSMFRTMKSVLPSLIDAFIYNVTLRKVILHSDNFYELNLSTDGIYSITEELLLTVGKSPHVHLPPVLLEHCPKPLYDKKLLFMSRASIQSVKSPLYKVQCVSDNVKRNSGIDTNLIFRFWNDEGWDGDRFDCHFEDIAL
ncbi:hypothetical protein BDF20DRAFT_839750 [Mycotypha africana]|uniref:uncharacterized protein n=1 Tax=Mycotypha africana TaxID=64632 RepID=UPI0023005574|nr:uncharacterized protein BDF20DRAFT_839750 [Mycotypha africana]KAI8967911.1 hypothetical protein BDF20DRAFT_839750 [Mycotypha africana]